MLAETVPPLDPDVATPGRWRRRVLFGAFAGYWALLFTATHVPAPQFVAQAMELNGDKLVHLGAYAVLATLMVRTLRTLGVRWASALTLLGCLAYGAADELTQPLANRVCDPLDFAADAAGAGLAVLIERWLRRP